MGPLSFGGAVAGVVAGCGSWVVLGGVFGLRAEVGAKEGRLSAGDRLLPLADIDCSR